MANLDDYLSTPDGLFNTNLQGWYFEFSGSNKPHTDKPFEVFAQALHDLYFFIQDNLNKPFGCIEKVKEVSNMHEFNTSEQVLLVNKILGIISHNPEQGNQVMVFIQLVDYRHSLSPYTDDIDVLNTSWNFDYEEIKEELQTIESPIEKHQYLMNLLFDYSAKACEIGEIEHQYYDSIGFVQWIKTEVTRCEYQLKVAQTTPSKPQKLFKINDKKLAKIDAIRIINALYELKCIELADGQIPSKEMFISTFGDFLGIDLSKYHTNLSQAFSNQTLEVNLKIFDSLKDLTQKAYYKASNK